MNRSKKLQAMLMANSMPEVTDEDVLELRDVFLQSKIWSLLKDAKSEIEGLMDGESCDHEVGVCWCETARLLERMEDMIKKLGDDE